MVCNEFSLLVSPVMPFHRPPVLAEKNALSLHCISLPHAPNPELWGRHSASAKPVFWAIFLKQLSNHMICWGKVPSKCLCFQHSLCACLFIAWKNCQIFKCIFRIYAHIGVSIQRLLCDIPKFAYKYVDGNMATLNRPYKSPPPFTSKPGAGLNKFENSQAWSQQVKRWAFKISIKMFDRRRGLDEDKQCRSDEATYRLCSPLGKGRGQVPTEI